MHHQLVRGVRRALTGATVLTCASALAAGFTAGAQARRATTHHEQNTTLAPVTSSTPILRGAGYLALGDSVSFGYMEPTVEPAPDYRNASTFYGFPEIVASDLHLKLTNAACPGETSASFVNDSARSDGCETSGGPGRPAYRTTFPLHVRYSGSQLAYAVRFLKRDRHVRLVTLMIGANDYFLCEEATADHCTSPQEQIGVVATVARNVRTIVSALREKAHYHGQLVLVDYYSISPSLAIATEGLDSQINQAAHGFHVRIANGFTAFADAAAHSGGNPCTAALLTQLSTGGCGVHPSSAGQTLLASTVIRAIRLR
jgi:lysophospholipase L1-like esterase